VNGEGEPGRYVKLKENILNVNATGSVLRCEGGRARWGKSGVGEPFGEKLEGAAGTRGDQASTRMWGGRNKSK